MIIDWRGMFSAYFIFFFFWDCICMDRYIL